MPSSRSFPPGFHLCRRLKFHSMGYGRLLLMRPWLVLVLLGCNFVVDMVEGACVPQSGCEVAYAYYKAQVNETLDSIGAKFQVTSEELLVANPTLTTTNIITNVPMYIPFKCECMQNQLLHMFNYQVKRADTVERIASTVFGDLTQPSWIGTWNAIPDINFILTGDTFQVPVKCFCGDPTVSLHFGLFLTYVVGKDVVANVSSLAAEFNTSEALLMGYNPGVNWNGSKVDQYAFIPVKDKSGNYPSYSIGTNNAVDEITTTGVLAGVAIGVGGALLFLSLLALCHQCATFEQRRRQQKIHIANKLKHMADQDPICTTGFNDAKT